MSEKLLQQILHELKDIKSDQQSMREDLGQVKSQLQENTDLTRAIHDRQEETDAKLEALSMDVHKIHGDVNRIDQKVDSFSNVLNKVTDLDTDVRLIKRMLTS